MAKCPNCGMTYESFRKMGRLGCSQCYETFKGYLQPLLKKIHGSSQHFGKAPVKAPKIAVKEKKAVYSIEELKAKMQKAIQAEEFEEAAKLRDQIRELEKREKEK